MKLSTLSWHWVSIHNICNNFGFFFCSLFLLIPSTFSFGILGNIEWIPNSPIEDKLENLTNPLVWTKCCPIFPFSKKLKSQLWQLEEKNIIDYLGSGLSPILSFFNSCTFDFDTTFPNSRIFGLGLKIGSNSIHTLHHTIQG